MLKSSAALAEKLKLPLVLHINDSVSLERCIEILQGESWIPEADLDEESRLFETEKHRILLHDAMTCCEGKIEHFETAIKANFHFIIAATGLTDDDVTVKNAAQECLRLIPSDKLIIGTDSPWKTPQNLEDTYLRTQRNEPSNIASLAAAVAETISSSVADCSALLRENTLRVFGLQFLASTEPTAADGENDDEDAAAVEAVEGAVKNMKVSGDTAVDEGVPKHHVKKEKASKATNNNAHYSCMKCRCRLFVPADVKTHALNSTSKTVFKVGEEGLCASTIFLKCGDGSDINATMPNLSTKVKLL